MGGNKTTPADKVMLLFCVLLSFFSFAYVNEAIPKGTEVRIEVDGKLVYSFPLDRDRTLELNGAIGKTLIEIKAGKVRIREAPCRNKICIHEGWIDRGSIICIPNKVVVTISRPEKNKEPDAVSG